MTLAKNEVCVEWSHENCYLVGGLTIGGKGMIFSDGEDKQIFVVSLHPLSRKYPEECNLTAYRCLS